MTFLNAYLLGGMLLVGVPVLLHFIMRQKPRQLAFPAFRFLRQKLHTNRRKLQLQNILLLLLRMLLIALLCLALARPLVQTGNIPFTADQEVAAILIFDSSPSMEYSVGTVTRMDEARQRARELIDQMAGGSRLAILDSAEEPGGDDRGQQWLSVAQARTRIDNLRIRPGNWPITRQLENACELLAKLGENADAPPRFLYVFSDRTTASWDTKAASKIQVPPGIQVVYVDVGVDNPRDLSIDNVTIDPPVAAPGQKIRIQATIRATGEPPADAELQCQLEGEAVVDRRVIQRAEAQVVEFERTAPQLAPGDVQTAYQVTVRLAANDALPSNNARYATFAVRNPRKVLTLVSNKAYNEELAYVWTKLLKHAPGRFEADVQKVEDFEKHPDQLKAYKIVCVFETNLPQHIWQQLHESVEKGQCNLILVPGGKDFNEEREAYNKAAVSLLPAPFEPLVIIPDQRDSDAPPGVRWSGYPTSHPVTAALDKWSKTVDPDFAKSQVAQGSDLRPRANAFWSVTKPVEKKRIVAAYDYSHDGKQPDPALLEREVGLGRVIQFTVPLDNTMLEGTRRWHNYWTDSSFGLVLVDLVCRYLAGETTAVDLNYLCRQRFTVPMPGQSYAPPFKLYGPGLSESESTLAPAADQSALEIPASLEAGNFFIRGSGDNGKDERTAAAFSVNIREEEYRLERIPAEEIEQVFGQNAVLPLDRTGSFADAIAKLTPPAREMLPYLMVFLLLMMPVESLLASLFTRRTAETKG